jgi:hypothetical protein
MARPLPCVVQVPAGVLHKKYKRVPLEPLENGVPVPAPDDVESVSLVFII